MSCGVSEWVIARVNERSRARKQSGRMRAAMRARKTSSAEQANELAVRANKQTEERMTHYSTRFHIDHFNPLCDGTPDHSLHYIAYIGNACLNEFECDEKKHVNTAKLVVTITYMHITESRNIFFYNPHTIRIRCTQVCFFNFAPSGTAFHEAHFPSITRVHKFNQNSSFPSTTTNIAISWNSSKMTFALTIICLFAQGGSGRAWRSVWTNTVY